MLYALPAPGALFDGSDFAAGALPVSIGSAVKEEEVVFRKLEHMR